tara:strand:- start:305 stop:775 length:471 start_codon:yes stop_codon:yes gene_type:complete
MSWWIWPTTADVGIRVFSSSESSLIDEAITGMQNIVFSDDYPGRFEGLVIGEIEWKHELDRPLDRMLVRVLEEVLYFTEVENKWVIYSKSMISDNQISIIFTYVDSNDIHRDVEIKAITRHSLEARKLSTGESISGIDGIPEMIGPGWFASIVFDL